MMLKMIDSLSKCLLGIIVTTITLLTIAQSNDIASVADSTDIKGQFEKLYKKANTYEQNKVILISDFNTLKKNSTDSIRMYKKEATSHMQETNSLKSKLKTYNTEFTQLKEELSTAQKYAKQHQSIRNGIKQESL